MFSVNSEVGRLREVVVHRPGVECSGLSRADVAAHEHDLFAKQLVDEGVVVHHFHDLLAESVDQEGARVFLAERLATRERFGHVLCGAVAELIHTAPARVLADALVGGLTHRELQSPGPTSSLLLMASGAGDFVLPPLSNQVFQRDSSAWIYGAVLIGPSTDDARRRESLNSQVVHTFHPMFRDSPPSFLGIDGGDIAVLGHRAVMVGMGRSTTAQAVELLAHRLFETGTADQVVVVELPKGGAASHLGAALTQVDRDAFSVHRQLPDELRSWTVRPALAHSGLAIHEIDDLVRELSFVLQVEEVRMLEAPVEHGNDFLAVEPGVVLGHECDPTNIHFLEEHGVRVIPVVGSELGFGQGGARRLSCPIQRDA